MLTGIKISPLQINTCGLTNDADIHKKNNVATSN